ncbi:MAG: hypothetical protein NTZ59_15610 [Bacteroidetes bacterium]|nr:hypothetical protein [Bacteroidota bacterium]
MKKIINFALFLMCFTILSCKKSENNSTSNNTSSPFTVKYEIIPTSKVSASWDKPIISYINSTGQLQTESVSNLSDISTWSKTITVTSTARPLQLSLLVTTTYPNYYLVLEKAGSLTQNIYVNGTLMASSTNQSSNQVTSFGYKIIVASINHTIQ